VIALADSFRFGNCVRRERLASMLAAAARPASHRHRG
jgi:hypothetical protein